MSVNKKNNKNSNNETKENKLSVFEDFTELTDGENAKNEGMRLSVRKDDKIIEADTNVSLFNNFLSKYFSKNENEIIVESRKKTKGYAPTVLAIILFSGLLFTNVLCQIKLDNLSNDMASMTREMESLKKDEKEFSYKLAQKDKEALEENENYIENQLGMVKEDPDKIYVDLEIEDEIYIIEEETQESGWTTMLSSVGRFFSDIFS